MDIKPTYVTFKQAKLLKEKGFDLDCKKYTSDGVGPPISGFVYCGIQAPEQWQVVEWLRVKYNILIESCWTGTDEIESFNARIIVIGETILSKDYRDFNLGVDTSSPQEAYSEAIDYILSNLI